MSDQQAQTTATSTDGEADAPKAAPVAKGRGRSGKAGKAATKPPKATKPARKAPTGGSKAKRSAPKGSGGRANTKQAQLIAMLRSKQGVTVEEAAKALGWQPHTVRGAIYGGLKKAGLNVASEKTEDRGRVYRIAD